MKNEKVIQIPFEREMLKYVFVEDFVLTRESFKEVESLVTKNEKEYFLVDNNQY